MDMAVMGEFLATYGFPIFACVALGWYVKDSRDKEREAVDKINENHTREMIAYKDELSKTIEKNVFAVENNTKAIEKLIDRLSNTVL